MRKPSPGPTFTGQSPKRWVLIRCCCRTSITCRRAATCTSSRLQSKARELAARSHRWYPRSCAAEFAPRSRRWRRLGESPWAMPAARTAPSPSTTLEMSLLYRCAWKLPDTRARQLLGYRPCRVVCRGMPAHDRLARFRRLPDDLREQSQSLKKGAGVRPQGAIERALQVAGKTAALAQVLLHPLKKLQSRRIAPPRMILARSDRK